MCSNVVRTQLLTSCVRRHVTKDVTYTKIHPERYYFCVVFGGGHFRSVTDSRKKHHGTIPHLITTQRVSGCVHPRDVTQNKYVQHTCTFFCNLVTRAGVSTSGATQRYLPRRLFLSWGVSWSLHIVLVVCSLIILCDRGVILG